MTYTVYQAKFPDDLVYIGQTKQEPPSKRWEQHMRDAADDKCDEGQKHFHRAIARFGEPKWSVLKQVSTAIALDIWEAYYIEQADAANPKHGYNTTRGNVKALEGHRFAQKEAEEKERQYKAEVERLKVMVADAKHVPTHYEVLGVSESASVEEIRAAYKSVMIESHPDKFQTQPQWVRTQAEAKAKAINAAYTALCNRAVAQPAPNPVPTPPTAERQAWEAEQARRKTEQSVRQAEAEERDRQRRNSAQQKTAPRPYWATAPAPTQSSKYNTYGILWVVGTVLIIVIFISLADVNGVHSTQPVVTDACLPSVKVQQPDGNWTCPVTPQPAPVTPPVVQGVPEGVVLRATPVPAVVTPPTRHKHTVPKLNCQYVTLLVNHEWPDGDESFSGDVLKLLYYRDSNDAEVAGKGWSGTIDRRIISAPIKEPCE